VSSDLRELLQSSLGAGYRLSRELGGGGMAKVFVADDPAVGRRVVVKVLSPDLAAGVNVDRFKREIQVAVSLHHPRIVPVLSAGQSGDDLLYYTMPYIEGETLRALIARECQLPLDRALAITHDVAEALQYAHEQNIVHRDIKPENILIEKESGRAVVTDFGIARAIERAADITTVTSTGLTLGTPIYMSPEQAGAEKHLDGRSDIYSLGCVLYEMLAGAPPFNGPTARAIIARHMTEPPPPIRVVRPDLPPGAAVLIERMLAKVPAGRLPSASALVDAVDHYDTLTMPSARSGRRTWIAAVAIVALAALAGGLALASRSRPPREAVRDPKKIAVFYLEAPRNDSQLVTVARGITRDLIYTLARVPELSLVSEPGIRQFSGRTPTDSVGHVLGVGTVVYGALDTKGDSIRVDVHLADATSLLEEGAVRLTYARSSLLNLRDTIVQEVAQQLRTRLGTTVRLREWQAGTRSQHAWELRQQAEELIEVEAELRHRPEDVQQQGALLHRADSLLAQASVEDPRWAEPLIERGWVMYRRALPESNPAHNGAMVDSALAFAAAVLARNPGDARALELRGSLRQYSWGLSPRSASALLDSAAADLRAATAINPRLARAWSVLSLVLSLKGDDAGAVEAARRALDADAYLRDAPATLERLVLAHLFAERYDSARVICDEIIRRFPTNNLAMQCDLDVLGWSGRGAQDVARVWEAVRRVERSGGWPLVSGISPHGRLYAAAVLARSGLPDSARAVFRATQTTVRAAGQEEDLLVNEAYVLTMLGDQDGALDLLERASRAAPSLPPEIARIPWFRGLHGNPRYQRLIAAR
jgi:serine/threonine-protein kinase